MKALLGSKIFDPAGNLLKDNDFREANSFVANFIKGLFLYIGYSATSFYNTANALVSPTPGSQIMQMSSGGASTSMGMLIGTGTDPVTLFDYHLQSQVTTNVAYGGMAFFLNCPSGNSLEFILSRMFGNNTGSVLNIEEVGLQSYINPNYFLLDRTLYSVSVPVGGSILLTYKIGTKVG